MRPVSSRSFAGSLKKDLAGDGKHELVCEAVEQWLQEIRLDAHVAVEQHDDVVPGGAEAGVRAAAEAQVRRQRDHANIREMRSYELRASVGGGVVDNDDLVAGMMRHRLDDGRQILLEQIAAVPVRDYHRSGRVCSGRSHEKGAFVQIDQNRSAMAIAAIGIRIRSGERIKRGR